jgi:hypothetical protein
MAPEQARGEMVDARSDLFSLGAVLYFMATGHPPFRAEQAMAVLHRICHDRHRPLAAINASLPDDLTDVVDRLLEKKPTRRFASAGDVQQALVSVLSKLQGPRPRRGWNRLRRVSRLGLRPVAAAAAAMMLAAISFGVWWFGDLGKRATTLRRGGSPQQAAATGAAGPEQVKSPGPSTTNASADAVSPTTGRERREPGADFARELSEIDGLLRRLEWPGLSRPGWRDRNWDHDLWAQECRAAAATADRLESSWIKSLP